MDKYAGYAIVQAPTRTSEGIVYNVTLNSVEVYDLGSFYDLYNIKKD